MDSWTPFDLGEFLDGTDVQDDPLIEMLPCFGRGLNRPDIRELKPPRIVVELKSYIVPGQVPSARRLGRGRGRALNSDVEDSSDPCCSPSQGKRKETLRAPYSDSDSPCATRDNVQDWDKLSDSEGSTSSATKQYTSHLTSKSLSFDVRKLMVAEEVAERRVDSCKAQDPEGASCDLPAADTDSHTENELKDQSKKKAKRKRRRPLKSTSSALDMVAGSHLVQIENIPNDFNHEAMLDTVRSIGKIMDSGVDKSRAGCSLRVSFESETEAKFAVECLNGSDVGGSSRTRLVVYRIQPAVHDPIV